MATQTMVDMDMVRSGLFLGSQKAEQASVKSLRAYGITHVLQLGTNPISMSPSHPKELTYRCIEVHDKDEADLIAALQKGQAIEFMDSAVKFPNSLLVHCQMGKSRSATTVIVYLMLTERITFWDALVQTVAVRHVVAPNHGFCSQAKAVEKCRGSLENYKRPNKKDGMTYIEWHCLIAQVQEAALIHESQWQHD